MGVKGNGGTRIQGQVGLGRGRESARGDNHSGSTTKHKGLCFALGKHIFDQGRKASVDQMRNTWENIVHHLKTINGHDISNELQNKKTVTIPKLDNNKTALDEQKLVTKAIDQSYQGLEEAHQLQKTVLEDQIIYIRHSIAPLSKMDQDFLKI